VPTDCLPDDGDSEDDGNNYIVLEFGDLHSELKEIRSVLERISYNLETFIDSRSNEYDVRKQG